MTRKFFSAFEAAEYAATITSEWRDETGNIMTTKDLMGLMSVADESGDIDGEDENCYYIVTDDGAIGATINGEISVVWVAVPTEEVAPRQTDVGGTDDVATIVCPACGTAVEKDAKYCPVCGNKIEIRPAERYCTGCGTKLPNDAMFCSECGTKAVPVTATTAATKKAKTGKAAGDAGKSKETVMEAKTVSRNDRPHGGIGYSKVIDEPRFQEAVRKNKKSKRGCATVLIAAPFVIFTLYGIFSDELGVQYGMFLGAVVSAVFFAFSFFAGFKEKFRSSWDGVVIEKYEKKVRVVSRHDSDMDYDWRTHYYTIVRRDKGGKEKIEERDPVYYSYMQVGDRIRYHGKMGLNYPYEKYDKSHDEHVICAFCQTMAPISGDTCPKCHNPLLK